MAAKKKPQKSETFTVRGRVLARHLTADPVTLTADELDRLGVDRRYWPDPD